MRVVASTDVWKRHRTGKSDTNPTQHRQRKALFAAMQLLRELGEPRSQFIAQLHYPNVSTLRLPCKPNARRIPSDPTGKLGDSRCNRLDSGVLASDVQSIAASGAGSANITWDRIAYLRAAAQSNTVKLNPGPSSSSVTIDADPNAVRNTLDFSNFSASQSLMVDIATTAAQTISPGILTLTLTNGSTIDNVIGGAGDDFISGNNRDNTLSGGAGNDVLDGRAGTNRLYGGLRNNRLVNGAGEWPAKFDNVPGDTTEEQLPYIQGLFVAAGLDQAGCADRAADPSAESTRISQLSEPIVSDLSYGSYRPDLLMRPLSSTGTRK